MCWVQILIKSLPLLTSAAKLSEGLASAPALQAGTGTGEYSPRGSSYFFPQAGILLFAQQRREEGISTGVRQSRSARPHTPARCVNLERNHTCPAQLKRRVPSQQACSCWQPVQLLALLAEAWEIDALQEPPSAGRVGHFSRLVAHENHF